MRKVRHKNVVQFIGACTRKPNLCIVFVSGRVQGVQVPHTGAACSLSHSHSLKPPHLALFHRRDMRRVQEFMSGGSVYDCIRRVSRIKFWLNFCITVLPRKH